MKVRLKFNMAGPEGSYAAGEIVDFPEDVALMLLGEYEGSDADKTGLPPQAERVDQEEDTAEMQVAAEETKEFEDLGHKTERAVDDKAEGREKADKPPHTRKRRPKRGVHE